VKRKMTTLWWRYLMSTAAACASEVIASSLAQRYKKRLFNVCAIETRKKIIEEISDEAYAILAD
jgi:hypothetical protein